MRITLSTERKTGKKGFCPVGCDDSRTETRISKPGRKNRGNFVTVFYRRNLQQLLRDNQLEGI